VYILKKIWKYTEKYKWFFILAILFSILNVIIAMVPGKLTQILVDDVIRGSNLTLLPGLLLGFFLPQHFVLFLFLGKGILLNSFHRVFLMT